MPLVLSILLVASFALGAPRQNMPKEVLAFYYGWYGNPNVSGRWLHWRNVDFAKQGIASSTHWPKLGPYDCHNPSIIDQHMAWAREAGITGFIVTWWYQDDFHDQGLPMILRAADKYGLKITVYYEVVKPRDDPAPVTAVADLVYLLRAYGKHPAWLKVDGKPVIFVYGRALNQIKLDGWKEVVRRLQEEHPAGFALIGDRITTEAAQVFDGIHTYNPTGRIKGMSPNQIRAWAKENYPAAVKTAGDKISCVTIIPGFDDHKLGRKEPRPITDRHDGETYRILWEEAIAADPDWVLITSWNEWHEGSEIEPSRENGDRALKATAAYTAKFRK